MFNVMEKYSKNIYRVFAIQGSAGHSITFLIYKGGNWIWVPADMFTPYFDDDGSGGVQEYDPNY